MNCYSIQTQQYFDEVLRTHESKCYRSAVVMLYSTVICDIMYKLRELHEIYGDSVASRILSDVDAARTEASGFEKSAWEWKLIEKVHQETNLIGDATFADIEYLKKQRNLCAPRH